MNIFQELRHRRVPQITSGYVVGSWGLLQFLDFLEGRMTISPNLVNLVGIGLLLLLPSVIILAWVHGRPGRDTWGRIPKVLVGANFLALVLLLFFMFRGQYLGAVAQTIDIQDENGTISERVVPKSGFRRRVLVFYPENVGSQEFDWARETFNLLLGIDLDQDIFVDPILPFNIVASFQDSGHGDGHGLSRSLQRKMTRDRHLRFFLTSTILFENQTWVVAYDLHDTESGQVTSQQTSKANNLFSLADLVSRQIREDLDIPTAHLESSKDLPIVDLTSSDLEAVTNYTRGLVAISHENDWAKAGPLLDAAVETDPGFAMAQFMRYGVYQTLGQAEKATEAITQSMKNLYRVPERSAFMIKSQYYFNVKQDADKSMAVLKMWSQLYPEDVEAYTLQGLYYFIRQDLPNALAAYETILEIDPSQVKLYRKIASLHQQLDNYSEAEKYYSKYVKMFPTDISGYRDLASFLSSRGRFDEARETLEKAQLIEPEHLELVLGLVDLEIKVGHFTDLETLLAKELARAETDRDRLQVLTRQIKLFGLLGRSNDLISALDNTKTALMKTRNPLEASLTYSSMVPSIGMAGQPGIALDKLEELDHDISDPYNKLLNISRAWILIDLGRTEEARAALAEGTEVVETFKFETFRPVIALIKAMAAEKDGDFATAIPLFKTALSTTIQVSSVFQIGLVRSLRKNDQAKQAHQFLTEALALDPGEPQLHLEMAQVLTALGKADQAQEHLKQCQAAWSQADPTFPPGQTARALASEIN